jgi:hypothetical protein
VIAKDERIIFVTFLSQLTRYYVAQSGQSATSDELRVHLREKL